MSSFIGMGAQGTGAGPLTPAYPGGYTAVANDWAEISVTGKASANTAPATPSGFTSLGGGRDATTTCITYIFAKLLTTSEAMPSIALPTNWSMYTVQVAIRRGTAAPTDLDTALTTQAAASATTWTPTSPVTTQHGSIVVSYVATDFDNAVGTFLNGNGFDERAGGAAYDVAGQFSMAMGDRVVRSAGSEIIMPTWEQTVNVSNPWFGVKFAIKDASPPTTNPPYLFASGALFAVASGTSITPVIPANDASNDILLMEAWTNAARTFTTPTNWTSFGFNENSANMSSAWFWKRATGSDGNPTSTVDTALSSTVGGYGRIYVIRGCVTTGDPFEDATIHALDLSTRIDTEAVTTTDVDRLVASYGIVDDDNVYTAGHPPANWVSHGPRLTSTTGGDAMSVAIEIDAPTATTVAQVSFGDMANDYCRSLTVAWIPVPVGGLPTTIGGAWGVRGN